ncbi:MAG: hypothetical protein LBU81_08415 [Methanosarcinales archaeon]|jgi:hypothetical protein|nr:hypothetical protein [Methanosarcinales archaeon]
MISKNCKLILVLSLAILSFLALSLAVIGHSIPYSEMSEAEQAEYDFQEFKKAMLEIYHQDVTKEDYLRIREGTFEMIAAYESDMEKYGKQSDEFNIANSDHVFIGRVVEHKGNYQAQPNEIRNPYNLFDVEIIELIKGPALRSEIELKQIGGYYTADYIVKEFIRESDARLEDYEKYDQGYYGFIESGDFLIEVGEMYLFITATDFDGRCTIFTPEDRILLEDFDEKSIESFDEIGYYKNLASTVKDFDRIRCIAKEEI